MLAEAIENPYFAEAPDTPSDLIQYSNIFQAIGALILIIVCLAMTGAGIRRLFKLPGSGLFSFETILMGLLSLAPLYAILMTHGFTMLASLPILLGLLLGFEKKEPGLAVSKSLRIPEEWMIGFIALIAYFFFYIQAFWSFDPALSNYPSGDLNYYCRLARHISNNHCENRLLDLVGYEKFWQAYHWGDIWLNSMLSKASGLQAEIALVLIVFPLLSALFVMGLYRLFRERWNRFRLLLVLLCLCAPMMGFFTGFMPASWKYQFHFFPAPLAQYPKMLLFANFFVWTLQSLRFKDQRIPLLRALVGALLYLGALPAALFFTAFQILRSVWKKGIQWRYWSLLIIAYAVTGLWCLFLYNRGIQSGPWLPDLAPFHQYYSLHGRIILAGIVESSMMLPYFFVLAAFVYYTRNSPTWLLKQFGPLEISLFIWLLGGWLGWFLLFPSSTDSFQFLENIRMVFLPVFALCCATLFIQSEKSFLALALLFSLVLISIGSNWFFCKEAFLTDHIERRDYQTVESFINRSDTHNGIKALVLKSPEATNRIATRNSTVFYPLEFLSLLDSRYAAYSLQPVFFDETDTTAINQKESLMMKWWSPLMQFSHDQKLEHVPADTLIRDFTLHVKPQILILANDAQVPAVLQPLLTADSIQLHSKKYRLFRFATLK